MFLTFWKKSNMILAVEHLRQRHDTWWKDSGDCPNKCAKYQNILPNVCRGCHRLPWQRKDEWVSKKEKRWKNSVPTQICWFPPNKTACLLEQKRWFFNEKWAITWLAYTHRKLAGKSVSVLLPLSRRLVYHGGSQRHYHFQRAQTVPPLYFRFRGISISIPSLWPCTCLTHLYQSCRGGPFKHWIKWIT